MSIAARRGWAFSHHHHQARDDASDAFASTPAAPSGAAALERVIEASRSTGTLNLSGRGLAQLPDSVCKPAGAAHEDSGAASAAAATATPWWESVATAKLDVSRNELEELPESLFADLAALQVLDVR